MPPFPARPRGRASSVWKRAALVALASVLTVGGLAELPASAAGPATTTTVLTASPTEPMIGDTVTLRAVVATGGVPVPVGQVAFDAAPSEEALWGADGYEPPYPDPTDVSLGSVAVGADGVAELSVQLDADTLGFLQAGTAFHVAAQYQPYELGGTGIYDQDYATSTSSSVSLTPTDGDGAVTISLHGWQMWGFFQKGASYGTLNGRGTLSAVAGTNIGLDASASLRGGGAANGTLRMSVDGESALGAAAFFAVGLRTYDVTVSFESSDPEIGSVTRSFAVKGVASTAAATTTTVSVEPYLSGSEKRVRATVRVTAADGSIPQGQAQLVMAVLFSGPFGAPVRLQNGVGTVDFKYEDLHVGIPNVSNSYPLAAVFIADRPFAHGFSGSDALNLTWLSWPTPDQAGLGKPIAEAKVSLAATNCAGGDTTVAVATGGAGEGTVSADVATSAGTCGPSRVSPRRSTTRVTCAPSATGYTCPLGLLAAGTRFSIAGSFPMPAATAGRKVTVTATATSKDLSTGATTTLGSSRTTVEVPKRTVLKASLAPVRKGASSVKHGKRMKYRVVVTNVGVVKATKVAVCVRLGAGAKVAAAHGATIHGRRACWMLPVVKKGAAAHRVLTLVAPRKKGRLKVALTVRPRPSQATPVRLTGVLPIR